ncbi:MAG: dTDP-4-dehydrorhamnose reductase [Calditrichia bacterium]
MKVMITGANGQLGQAVFRAVKEKDQFRLCDIHSDFLLKGYNDYYCNLDITKADELRKLIAEFGPDYIVNCAAFTNVDACETEKELSWNVNVKAVEQLAYLSRIYHYHLIHISTDYVFDGLEGPYSENDRPNPISFYGKEKLASENAVLNEAEAYTIIRTNVLFDYYPGIGDNFFTWLIKKLFKGEAVRIVSDQFNNPNYAYDLAKMIYYIMERGVQGVYHCGGEEYMSRYELAIKAAEWLDLDKSLITPVLTSEFKQAAKRPLRGGLKIDKAKRDLGYRPTSLHTSLQVLHRKLMEEGEF